ncbi:hypothetical protein TNCT_347351 [Trichonephila clavata]|uniref:Uncharacterized protein n=1 Tax=Trichonephila clavata TaxID=2740835 RepID=A0A8X6FAC8_TRICU|nr:hypothetical protein TNCT_347351 [Trichonephila clavata]
MLKWSRKRERLCCCLSLWPRKAYTKFKTPRRSSISKPSPTQLSNTSMRHTNKQEDEKGWQRKKWNTEGKHFSSLELHRSQMFTAKPHKGRLKSYGGTAPQHDRDNPE